MNRPFTVLEMPQRSPEWLQARAGRLTGSCAAEMLAKGRKRGEESVQRRNLRMQLALERITGVPLDDGYVSAAMKRGIEMEAAAAAAYEAATGYVLRRTGFLRHDIMPVGASLDGHVGDFVGIVELKCPIPATHWDYIRAKTLPAEYAPQVTHQLWLTGAEWADFCSFDSRFPGPLQLLRVRVPRSGVDLKAYDAALRTFLVEVDQQANEIRAAAGGPSMWQLATEQVGAA